MLGVVVVDKPQGLTSHDVVNRVRRTLGTRRVGHAGSLDPMATGALVVAVGPATRFLQYLSLEPKDYDAQVTFGAETDSQDAEGEVVSESPVPIDLEARVEAALPAFMGEIHQLPPMYSAVKKDGQPLYKYARRGEEVERQERTVYIKAFDIVECQPPTMRFRVRCSGGTYVRTLAHDLGQSVGCGAHLSALRRRAVGRFSIDEAIALDDVSPMRLIPLEEALKPLPMFALNDHQVRVAAQGQSVPLPQAVEGRLAALLDTEGHVFCVARVVQDRLYPECVIPREALYGSI